MNINKQTKNVVVVYFPKYGAGKFVINCLLLSKHSAMQDKKSISYILNNPTDYDFRLHKVLNTVPDKNNLNMWWEHELKHDMLFSSENIPCSWYTEGKAYFNKFDQTGIDLVNSNLVWFITIHGGSTVWLNNILNVWPNASIINVIKYTKIWNISIKIKDKGNENTILRDVAGNDCFEAYQEICGNDWPSWEIFEQCNYNIDKVTKIEHVNNDIVNEIKQYYKWHEISNPTYNFDMSTIFDENMLLCEVEQLYKKLGFTDFNINLIKQYYRKYIELHKE